ncbi:hypothetical protein M9H77_06348 [Catharanthus roseus]|uniref:Uncharacterized protein n=1 Tax=Catharanthus roseus TaxID=4058 RepID=A0ACC0BRV5_CATRO|nr:hypothetical protein M9H77_06348 [Catharanthus roseus]
MGLNPLHAHPLGKVNIKPILLRQQTQDTPIGISLQRNLRPSSRCQESQLRKDCPCFIWAFLRRRCYPPKIPILLSVSGQGGHGIGAGPWLIVSDFNVEAYLLGSEVRCGPYGGVIESVLLESLPKTGKVAILVVSFDTSNSYPNGPSLYGVANRPFRGCLR